MYRSCITCHRHLGLNQELPVFPVGRRIAFDAGRGRLWVVCPHCARWNLSPLEERWEAIELCERSFRSAHLGMSTGEIGLARLSSGLELIRIGRPRRTEVAAWRYGDRLLQLRVAATGCPRSVRTSARRSPGLGALRAGFRAIPGLRLGDDPGLWWRIHRQPGRIVETVACAHQQRAILRYRHLAGAELVRPGRMEPWRLVVHHEVGPLELASDAGLHAAGKILAALNGAAGTPEQVQSALRRLEDAANPDSYFAQVSALALRTSWGRLPGAPRDLPVVRGGTSTMEQLALRLTSRSFWAQGGTGSEPRTLLFRLSPEDRLALEMAANEDSERRALAGELAQLKAAWQRAEEIAAIADSLFDEDAAALQPGVAAPARGLPETLPGLTSG